MAGAKREQNYWNDEKLFKVRGRLEKTGIWSQESGVNYTLTATEVRMMLMMITIIIKIITTTIIVIIIFIIIINLSLIL